MGGNNLSGGSTRLDGLLSLLESGSNASVRKMAASQIGELVGAHPSETRPVLGRVRRLLCATTWETRIAAGQAIAAIADQSPRFVPDPSASSRQVIVDPSSSVKQENNVDTVKSEEQLLSNPSSTNPATEPPPHSFILDFGLQFNTFDLDKLMRDGAMLFASSGDEYKVNDIDIATQRARLKADLGLDERFAADGDTLGLRDEDLINRPAKQSSADLSVSDMSIERPTADFVAEMSAAGVSARERNRLKRVAKRKAKQGADVSMAKPNKRPRTNNANESGDADQNQSHQFSLSQLASANDEDTKFETMFDDSYWDFQPTVEALKENLLLTRWEWRHGAVIGLRQILVRHAHSAGRRSASSLGDEENSRWLEDICCRLLCVLAMDRFGDFVGDAVVAPVREAAAMTIGAAARLMSDSATKVLVDRLLFLLRSNRSSQWEVRHASLLGARFVLAVKNDMAQELLDLTFDSIADGLQDCDDDVRAVAAEALLPVVKNVISFMSARVPRLVSNLWEALLDLDDICASTSSIMKLLSEISTHPTPPDCNPLWLEPGALGELSDDENDAMDLTGSVGNPTNISRSKPAVAEYLVELVPRLWPFFRHSSKGVRRAAINLLETITRSFHEDDLLQWILPIATDLFTRLYRNILLETETDILEVSQHIWERALKAFGKRRQHSVELVRTFSPLLRHWVQTASQETRAEAAAYDEMQNKAKVNVVAARRKAAAARRAAKARKAKVSHGAIPQNLYGSDSAPAVEGPYDGAVMQRNATIALGLLAVYWPTDDLTCERELLAALQSPHGIARRVACDILQQWAERSEFQEFVFSNTVKSALDREILTDASCAFAEIGSSVGSFFTDTLSFLDNMPVNLDGIGLDITSLKSTAIEGKKSITAQQVPMTAICALSLKPKIHQLVTGDTWEYLNRALQSSNTQKRIVDGVGSLRMRLLSSLGYMDLREETIKVSLAASATSAVVCALGCPLPQKVGPLIRSLTAAIRSMINPHLQLHAASAISKLALRLSKREPQKPVMLMLKNLMKYLTAVDGGNVKEIMKSFSRESSIKLEAAPLAKRGALLSMKQMCVTFKESMFSSLPSVWYRISDPLTSTNFSVVNMEVREAMIILRAIVPYIHESLHVPTATLFPYLIAVCAAPHDEYASEATQCLADTVAAIPGEGMQSVVMKLIPLLGGNEQDKDADRFARRGAAKGLRCVVAKMGTALIPYAAFMIVPMMTRMVDEDEIVRDAAAGVFGTLIRLMPLEGGTPDDPSMSESMAAERQSARSFLGQLLGTEARHHYQLNISIGDDIVLRDYQQECLDWLAFLNRYGLHGALCDDMGLGKTLMTLCMIAGDYSTIVSRGRPRPSLVLCPSTIVAHWVMEAERFFGHALPRIVQYSGPPRIRARIRGTHSLQEASLIVTSYEVLSNDLRHFDTLRWNYLVLDEGHVIKNSKTRVAKAVRTLSADHRLILTGTPIQNSVLELWAMFDFLMPGFLGSEKLFKETYAKPIMASRDSKCNEAGHERGIVATESLHRQVLPFVLRRLKDDVLKELPPKTVQDYFCNMTPLQLRLYEDFATDMAQGGTLLSDVDGSNSNKTGGSHVFQALSYLRRLCSHPKLVLTPKHPEYASVHHALREQGKRIDDITSSAKLVGLMNILHECGIGKGDVVGRQSGGHRVLIFAQLKQMLDLVESDLFRVHMPEVTYLRLDGSVESGKRQPIATRFNADPTIDCLLLTTHVGGLGLNLTGADTVIFLEHDWNPSKDLQAMDRAHRLGQKRSVNVYRLITRGTLEEKIMSIQKFKTKIATTVVNRDNSTLQSMNTEQFLNLFEMDKAETASYDDAPDDVAVGSGKGMKVALAGLGDLWEEGQYEEEYNMQSFLDAMDPSISPT